jgi:hypothetical protein
MRFLCLVVVDEKKLAAMTKKELQHLDNISLDFDDTLRRNGQFLAAAALQPVRNCKTVRVNNGKVLVPIHRNKRTSGRLHPRGSGKSRSSRAGSLEDPGGPAIGMHRSPPGQGIATQPKALNVGAPLAR